MPAYKQRHPNKAVISSRDSKEELVVHAAKKIHSETEAIIGSLIIGGLLVSVEMPTTHKSEPRHITPLGVALCQALTKNATSVANAAFWRPFLDTCLAATLRASKLTSAMPGIYLIIGMVGTKVTFVYVAKSKNMHARNQSSREVLPNGPATRTGDQSVVSSSKDHTAPVSHLLRSTHSSSVTPKTRSSCLQPRGDILTGL